MDAQDDWIPLTDYLWMSHEGMPINKYEILRRERVIYDDHIDDSLRLMAGRPPGPSGSISTDMEAALDELRLRRGSIGILEYADMRSGRIVKIMLSQDEYDHLDRAIRIQN